MEKYRYVVSVRANELTESEILEGKEFTTYNVDNAIENAVAAIGTEDFDGKPLKILGVSPVSENSLAWEFLVTVGYEA